RARQLRDFAVDYVTRHGVVNPQGKPSLFQELDKLRATWKDEDAALAKRIRTLNDQARGIGFDDIVEDARKSLGSTGLSPAGDLPSFGTEAEVMKAIEAGQLK